MSEQSGTQIFRLVGVVDFLSVTELQAEATAALDAVSASGRLIVDCAAVTFVDSTGLSLLIYLKGLCDGRGVRLELQAVPRRVQDLIASMGLQVFFNVG